MKILATVAVGLVLASLSDAITLQEQKQLMVGIAQECKGEVGASDTDLSLLILKKPMTTKEGKCLLFCIMEQMGAIDGGTRKIKKDEFIEYISVPAKNDAKIISKMTAIADKCSSVTDADNCEMAFKLVACIKSSMAAEKIKQDIGI